MVKTTRQRIRYHWRVPVAYGRFVSVANHSDWSDELLRALVEWLTLRAGIRWNYYLAFAKPAHARAWGGLAWGRSRARVTVGRSYPHGFFPYHKRDERFAWAKTYEVTSPLELLIAVTAHEVHHANGGHPSVFKPYSGDDWQAHMEYACHEFAWERVQEFRTDPVLRDTLTKLQCGVAPVRRSLLTEPTRQQRLRAAADGEASMRGVSAEQEAEYRQWARDNYDPDDPDKNVIRYSKWHAIVIDECLKIRDKRNRAK